MDFGRYDISRSNTRKLLPQEWTDGLNTTLNEVYAEQLKVRNSFFDVYGELYDKEFVVIASMMHESDATVAPVSIFVSHDVIAEEKKYKKVLQNMVDLIGAIVDDVLASENCDYNANWTENEFKGDKFFYKITRENISLTLQAEAILLKGEKLD